MKLLQKNDFDPDWLHPYYFIRKGLYNKIKENAGYINGKVLDFGCGCKPYKSLLSADEYTGLDYENKGHSHEEENIDVFYNGESIPFEDLHFNSIISTEVFEHIFNLETVLKELHRVLQPGGHLLITCPFVWNEHEVPHDYARYTRFSLGYLLKKAGFEIVQIDKSGNFITALFQLFNLYLFGRLYNKCSRYLLTAWIYKLLIVLPVNAAGVLFNLLLLPTDRSLYLNNIIVAKKPG